MNEECHDEEALEPTKARIVDEFGVPPPLIEEENDDEPCE